MTTQTLSPHDHSHHYDGGSKSIFGFWIFLLSDCVMFAALFAAYVVLQHNTYGGIGIRGIATLPFVFVLTLILAACSFTYGLAAASGHKQSGGGVQGGLWLTLILGLGFVFLEYYQFYYLLHEGNSWHNSAFLSAFFALAGIHWIHVIFALLWTLILIVQFAIKGVTPAMKTRLTCLGMFWHFLNIIWVCIFVIVYLMGAI